MCLTGAWGWTLFAERLGNFASIYIYKKNLNYIKTSYFSPFKPVTQQPNASWEANSRSAKEFTDFVEPDDTIPYLK
jgi:hypothetical protein